MPFSRFVIVVLVPLLLAGCATLESEPTPRTPAAEPLAREMRLIEIEVGERRRTFWYVDPFVPTEPRPLLIALHGLRSDGLQFMADGKLTAYARQFGYVLVAPNAAGIAFTDGSTLGDPAIDDVAFINAVIARVASERPIGEIHVIGFATGASMGFRFAAESGRELAGLGLIGGHPWLSLENGTPAVPTMIMYGDSDPFNPADGGTLIYSMRPLRTPAIEFTARRWARQFGCNTTVSARIPFARQVGRYDCADGAAVILVIVNEHGHYWPSVPKPGEFLLERRGPMQTEIEATNMILQFFEEY